ncbi:MAG: S46 family peptidase [Alphaproteobacteria bacterium]|nr:S46 family peptidase [Alphaproteobacteria bacterium]
MPWWITLVLSTSPAPADEGMWLPEQVPAVAARYADAGLVLDPAALADPLGDPLGAIVTLGFCSASFVSPDGLVVTNHHCVEGFLQYQSTGQNNRHRDGFVAPTRADEITAGPTARLRVVERLTDVTAAVMDGIGPRTRDQQRHDLIEAHTKHLVAACESEPNRRCSVVPYFGGTTWRLIQTLEIKDVRLVMAPPASLGQFGGEIDNWMWPRHGADFAFLRAYVAPDGSSRPYAEDNVPYHPPHHLTVGTAGVADGDFVMVAGFPGRTERHQLAMELAWQAETVLPRAVDVVGAAIAVMQAHADADPEAMARLGDGIGSLANYLKNSQGMLAGLSHGDVVGDQRATEATILDWIRADKRRARTLLPAFTELQERLEADHADNDRTYEVRMVARTADLLGIASDALRAAQERPKPDALRDVGFQDRDLERRKGRYAELDTSLWLPADRELMTAALTRYLASPADHHVPAFDAWLDAHGGPDAAIATLFDHPALASAEARLALLDADLATLQASTDPWVSLAVALEKFHGPRRAAREASDAAIARLREQWMAAKVAWSEATGVPVYDDANSTLRLTLGTVQGYHPQDGLWAEPFTTLAGLAAKAGPPPFDAPAAIVEAARHGATSRWAVPGLGDVPVDFLSDLDITGGNSGSAVLDGRGHLVGLAFDGNWESILGDWTYQHDVNRCIGVDVRFVLWVLEQDPATLRLLDELGVPRP